MMGIPFRKRSTATGKKRSSRNTSRAFRRACFEPLETRQLLSISLPTIPAQTVLTSSPLNLALDVTETEGHAVTYSVSVANSTIKTSAGTSSTLGTTLSTSNPSLKLRIDSDGNNIHGDVIIQLFQDLAPKTVAKIQSLVNSHYYDGLIFHRVGEGFMIQGGDPLGTGSGGPGFKFDDEFNASLQFTGPGLLAMANSGRDTNGSQFFITVNPLEDDPQFRAGDFSYTIFGMVTQGYDIVEQVSKVPHPPSADGTGKPNNNVVITSATMITDNQNGVLRLSSPIGTSGTANVTVTARDSVTGETASRTFAVTVQADNVNNKPFLGTIPPLTTNANSPINYYIPATDVEGNAIYYSGTVSPSNPNITVTVNSSTGLLTITPNGTPGVYSVLVSVRPSSSSSSVDSQYVPVYVKPVAPSSIALTTASNTGAQNDTITKLNNTSSSKLSFQVGGVVSGATVELFSDGTLIGSAIATGTSVVITTNGTFTLTDGAHVITARQTLKNKTVDVGNYQSTTDLDSPVSSNYTITVETTQPTFNFIPPVTAVVDQTYTCQVVATDASGTLTYQLAQNPSGMTIDAATGLITWTPSTTTQTQVIVRATDTAGNTVERSFHINVLQANIAPVLVAANATLQGTNEDTPTTITVLSLINNGTGTTSVTDEDTDAVVGGIAIIGVTGRGTWQYSLDGTTFQNAGTISATSALLLPKTASIRYLPDGANGENASFTYRAWDTTSGAAGGRASLAAAAAVGGATAYSQTTDTATIPVTALNDAPVVVTASPKLGSTTPAAALTIPLVGRFINNGVGTTAITDVDQNAVVGGIAITGATGNGTWEYSLDGTSFVAFGTISASSVLLLPKTASIRYTPSGTTSETATLSYRAWDTTSGTGGDHVDLSGSAAVGGVTALSSAVETATVLVNDAPVLTPASPSLGTTNEDTAIVINLSGTFINNGTGTTTITDPNTGASVGGIAIIGVSGQGTWKYSLNGTTYYTLTAPSPSSALLLPSTAKLRYEPDGKNAETPTITYRAWDQTTGEQGNRVDISQATAVGGSTSYSAASDTATLTITAVNDAPVLVAANPSLGVTSLNSASVIALSGTFINNGSKTTTITDIDQGTIVGGIAIVAAAGTGTWEYSLDGTTFTAMGSVGAASALLLPKEAKLRFTPTGVGATPSITYYAWDKSTGTSGSKVDVSSASARGGTTAFSSVSDTATLTLQTGSISGFVYLDTDNDGLRLIGAQQSHLALPGVAVKLLTKNSSGAWVEVSGKSPVLTGADGSYRFDNLAVGTYRVQEVQPGNYLDGKDSLGKIAGSVRGTASNDQFEVALGIGEKATEYNFGERGLKASKFSFRMLLASAPSAEEFVSSLDAAPTLDLAKTKAGTGNSTAYYSSGSPVTIAAADATVADKDSALLAWLTATITNLKDGAAEKLEAVTTNTPLTANYANGVLTLSGVAAPSFYQQVLRTIKYSNSASSPNTEDRSVRIVANDGVTSSQVVIAKVAINRAAAAMSAVDSALSDDSDWLSD